MLPPDSLKSEKTDSSDNPGHIYCGLLEIQAKSYILNGRKNTWISAVKSTSVKILIWSESLGTGLLRTAEFIKILRKPKIIRPKS